MKSIGIKYQLRITTLIPVLVVALLFALFYNGKFSRDLKQHTSHLGEAYIRQLLPAAQLALLRDDKRILQGLIDASTINQEVQSLAFYNAKGQLLAYRGGKHSLKHPFTPPDYTGDYIESRQINPYSINFLAPITVPKFNLYSFTPFKSPTSMPDFQADDILGWLSIDIDTQATLIKRYQMYIVTIFITLFGLLTGLSIHYFFSKKIYIPIARLRRSMKQILSNEFETEIKLSSQAELGTIEQGCAHLQKQYLSMVKDLNQYIETATTDLQKNLELLEEKNIELSLDKKKSEEKSRQKSEFIANMSHEIRTPMNGILGFTNVLLESKLDSLQQEYVKTIKSSAQDLLAIINDILDYSKMDAGKLHLDYIPLDIRACIDDVVALLAPHAHKKGLDLIPATDIAVPKTVLGDPLRLKQIISNLVSNAIKFTDHGYVLIRTHIEQESETDYTICLAISDTGIGICSEDQTTLFNAFNQADTTITRRFGGSGLGLVISKKLAEHMQGRISLSSEPHKGSTFSVHIKLAKLMAYEIEKHQIHRFGNLKVLCFDDNPLHLEALCNGLGYWGIQCIRIDAFNQLEQAFYQHQDCHLAFVSVNQGCEQQVAEVLRKQSMPCVLVSKWPIQNYQALGAQGFLFKPPNIQKLHETIEHLFHQASIPTSAESMHIQELDTLRARLRLAKPNLLVAEDNPINRMLLNALLSEKTCIDTVEDGQQAVTKCNSKRFHAILLDLQMPKLDGFEAARLIRQQSLLNKTTPIILLSANSMNENNESMQKLGIDLCLQKPLDEASLLRHLLKIINQTTASAINWTLCVQKVSGNQALATEFLDRFVEELHKNREEFLQLMASGQIKNLERAAHKLHGACCFCGVPQLQSQVAQLEALAKQASHIDELQMPFSQFIQSLDAVIEEYEHSYRARDIVELL
ncbi:two-component system sensor histidine kinase LetS [Legionella oakridgensis]|uniref:two-component system sensor histidine kinase LetS n=1 Tax=Legionella oakridgensis TaxID=29423 RepID=UPI0003DE2A5A|nr:ATP-binding protein [Legionella oakridgensis]ETO93754.1 His kinase A (phospho-acceptor) domain protein [Legionella oakridgensis RV-2-2007]